MLSRCSVHIGTTVVMQGGCAQGPLEAPVSLLYCPGRHNLRGKFTKAYWVQYSLHFRYMKGFYCTGQIILLHSHQTSISFQRSIYKYSCMFNSSFKYSRVLPNDSPNGLCGVSVQKSRKGHCHKSQI